LAPSADEGRGTLRKAPGSREQAFIRGCPNGETHSRSASFLLYPPAESISRWKATWGTETSKYPEEKKSFR
jgi:hypothetical protein